MNQYGASGEVTDSSGQLLGFSMSGNQMLSFMSSEAGSSDNVSNIGATANQINSYLSQDGSSNNK